MVNRNEELDRARAQMQNAGRSAPQPVEDDSSAPSAQPSAPPRFVSQPSQEMAPSNNSQDMSAGEMSVLDFMQAAAQPKFADKFWASKGKKIKVKKFSKGELDRISSPLFKRTMKLDLSKMGNSKDAGSMNVDISMDLFMEMEKLLVEIGMCYYVDNRNQPVITREYIDTSMTDDDFKELSALIKEVNPKALVAGMESQQEIADAKK